MSTAHPRELLEPIFGDHPGVIRRAAGDDRHALDAAQIEAEIGQRDRALERADIALQRLRDDDRLLENLLAHEVRVIALVDLVRARRPEATISRVDRLVGAIENLDRVAPHHRPVALFQIGDLLGQRGQRQRVRAEIILALAVADRQRRPHPRADHQIGMIAEQEGDRERPVQPRQHRRHRVLRRRAAARPRARPDAPPLRCRSRSGRSARRRSIRRAAA